MRVIQKSAMQGRGRMKTVRKETPASPGRHLTMEFMVLLNVRKFNKKYCRMQVGVW